MIQTLYAPHQTLQPRVRSAEFLFDMESESETETARLRFDRWPLGPRGALVESFVAGRRHGWSMAFYNNGRKACEGAFVDGAESGWWVFWNEDGSPAGAIEFARGMPCRPMPQSAAGVTRAA